MWNRVKKMFKRKKPLKDHVVLLNMTPKDITPYEVPSNMKIHTKFMDKADTPKGQQQLYRFEVNGVTVTALDVLDAQSKYLRRSKENG